MVWQYGVTNAGEGTVSIDTIPSLSDIEDGSDPVQKYGCCDGKDKGRSRCVLTVRFVCALQVR